MKSGRSTRSGKSRSSRGGVQIIDGDSEIDDSDCGSMYSNTQVNIVDTNDKTSKKIFHTQAGNKRAPTMEIEELDEEKEDDNDDFDASYIDSNSGELVINFD